MQARSQAAWVGIFCDGGGAVSRGRAVGKPNIESVQIKKVLPNSVLATLRLAVPPSIH